MKEYERRFHMNMEVTGFGVETTQHMPCPFCAAPNFLVARILDIEHAMGEGRTCNECHRSAKAIYYRSPNQMRFEIVQTGGPEQPEWMTPKLRYVTE